MTSLVELGLERLEEVDDLSPLGDMRALTHLALYGYRAGSDFGFLSNLADLRMLDLGRTPDGVGLGVCGGLRQLAEYAPGLSKLGFLYVRPLEDLDHLAHFAMLEKLSIRNCHVEDLAPLATARSLRTLEIVTPINSDHLAQISQLTQLTTLQILSSPDDPRNIDLSGLGDVRLTVRAYLNRHRFVNTGKRIKVKWL
jgi:hypothetical protein